jgi:hypothetical protein
MLPESGTVHAKLFQEVIGMEPDDIETISEIAARYGFSEWALVGFTSKTEYHVFSYFSDLSVMPVFKAVLISILKTLDEYMQKYPSVCEETYQPAGTC